MQYILKCKNVEAIKFLENTLFIKNKYNSQIKSIIKFPE